MVKLRLKRMGSKFNAFYRIVASDARAPRDGRFIEAIGYYNPHTKEAFLNDKLKEKWESEGARPSETVKNLFKKIEVARAKGNVKNNVVTLEIKAKNVKKETKLVIEETSNHDKEQKIVESKSNELDKSIEDKIQKAKESKENQTKESKENQTKESKENQTKESKESQTKESKESQTKESKVKESEAKESKAKESKAKKVKESKDDKVKESIKDK